MKIVRTVIAIVFVVGTIAIIVYDGQTAKKHPPSMKGDSSKVDSAQYKSIRK